MKRKWMRMTVVLSLCLAVLLPVSGSAAQFVDLQRDCSLHIFPVDPEKKDEAEGEDGGKIADDLTNDKVVIDLYKVADAVPNGVYDGYGYEMKTAYAALQVEADIDAEGWQDLALSALQIALKKSEATGAQALQPDMTVRVDTADRALLAQKLSSGLYLLVARGADALSADDYAVQSTRTVTGADGQQTEETYISATAVYTAEYVYSFIPVLVSLPSKDPDADGVISSANRGEWIYDLEVVLKPGREPRYGPLRIIKYLLSYETAGTNVPATVVFEVEAVWHDRLVYSDVVALSFTEPGRKEILIENKIPVGSQVTVTELYSGSSYSLVEGDTAEKIVWVNDTVTGAEVTFTNDYDSHRGGHGITNHFAYEEIGGGILGWNWTQIPSTAEGEHSQEGGE